MEFHALKIDSYKERLEERIISRLAEEACISLERAIDVYYRSRLARQIAEGLYGIENLDYKYLVDDLIENEPELLGQDEAIEGERPCGVRGDRNWQEERQGRRGVLDGEPRRRGQGDLRPFREEPESESGRAGLGGGVPGTHQGGVRGNRGNTGEMAMSGYDETGYAGGSRKSSFSRNSRTASTSRSSSQPPAVLKPQTVWESLYFYQKTVVLYQMTVVFCKRFLPKYGDRTVDQMVQAARSGKQNIVEGFADGVTSTEMELKLLNVARASIKELKEDYIDYLRSRGLVLWDAKHPRYDGLLKFCRAHNKLEDYESFFEKWTDEEMANCANTLCHMVDRMMATHLAKKTEEFTENGGIRERMTAARLGRRQMQNEEIAELKAKVASLERENAALRAKIAALGGEP